MEVYMIKVWKYIMALALMLAPLVSEACTAVIVSGAKTADGRPLMWKNRDTDCLDNSVRHFKGEKYSFVGLVNSDSPGGEVWIGANTAGFAIMNTASYCLKDDDVPTSMMDREGILMYRALEICATLGDFEHFLDTLSRPLGVESNFGCIDAFGGAAWYETGNFSYHKRDVNKSDEGYIVVTNFSVSGPVARWRGVERWMTAQNIFSEMDDRGELSDISPLDIVDSLSRSYRHELMGIDLGRCAGEFLSRTSGYFPDMDFIPRKSTSASVVIHGAADGGDPASAVFWVALGYPAVAVTVPVPVSEDDHVPACLSGYPQSDLDTFSGLAAMIKDSWIFTGEISNMPGYVNLEYVLGDTEYSRSTLACCREAEAAITGSFLTLYERFMNGSIAEGEYLRNYDSISAEFFPSYTDAFDCYIHWRGPIYIR